MEKIRNFFKDESGASAVEYGLLVALIAVSSSLRSPSWAQSIAAMFTMPLPLRLQVPEAGARRNEAEGQRPPALPR